MDITYFDDLDTKNYYDTHQMDLFIKRHPDCDIVVRTSKVYLDRLIATEDILDGTTYMFWQSPDQGKEGCQLSFKAHLYAKVVN